MRKKIPAVSFLVPSKHENKATMGERLSKQVVKVFPIITSLLKSATQRSRSQSPASDVLPNEAPPNPGATQARRTKQAKETSPWTEFLL